MMMVRWWRQAQVLFPKSEITRLYRTLFINRDFTAKNPSHLITPTIACALIDFHCGASTEINTVVTPPTRTGREESNSQR